jgi:RNA polymerase sigma-70 factor (ECF subfamily)
MPDFAPPDRMSLARYRQYLRSVARARFDPRLQTQLDPSDIVQETLLKAHRAIGEFRGKTELQLTVW